MKARKWILAAAAVAAVAAVSGCAYDPYYDNNYAYRDYRYDRYGYGSDYYVAPPAVAFGYTYDRRHYWDGRRWHHWDGERWTG
jgi:hypothetical protein